jgi:hypothetical protein
MRLNFRRILCVSVYLGLLCGCGDSSDDGQKNLPDSNGTSSDLNKETTGETSGSFKLQSFPFVGRWYGKTGIFKYDLTQRKYKTIWWNTREDVIMLIYKPEDRPSFFLTSTKYGMKGNFPFINKIRLYRINNETYRAEKISDIGSGVQMTAYWNDEGNLEVIYTAVDETRASYVNEYRQVYNPLGKLIDDEIQTFDIEKDGFPELLPKRGKTLSHTGKYGISAVNDSVFLKSTESEESGRKKKFITMISHSLNKVEWSADEEYLFFSTIDLKNESEKTKKPETSELFVYTIKDDSLVTYWAGAGVKNFFTSGDLLIFDDDFGKNSEIYIYNYRTMNLINEIKMSNGCGLVYVPEMKR